MSEIESKQPQKGTGLEIAVIGMAGRFPGAEHLSHFWENLKNGVEYISFLSEEELKEAGSDSGIISNPNFVKCMGGILQEKEMFDASFFDYTPLEAEIMDPQMRIFHECAFHALEDAGYDSKTYPGLIGLYAGASFGFYWESRTLLWEKSEYLGGYAAGQLNNRDYLTTRVSYKLNLKGPSVFLQTACSTSLVAIHMACRALLTGECKIALAGGVSMAHWEENGYIYQEGLIFSPDGHCRAFDANAAGTVNGNGVGIVVLKLLKEAAADGDYIYALIKGSAVNNDGRFKIGYTAPGVKGQAEVIRAALRMARVEPESITYVEAHGTGTILGDPVEIQALQRAFNTDKKQFCGIGSVKTNFGHLDSAAGVAGFIKTVLALTHHQIPPSLNFETPNPKIDFENTPFYVNVSLKEWTSNGYPLRAGVSSFGIGGTNAHVVLEEAPVVSESAGQWNREYQLMLLSARTETALQKMAENLADHLKRNPGINLADAAYTLQVGRQAFLHRKMLVCTASENLHTSFSTGESRDGSIVFMFSGQGSQYVNMGLDLYKNEPVFRKEMDRCIEILKPIMGYDIKEVVYSSYTSDIDRTEIAQPLLFVFEYALAKLLMAWGIAPDVMIGHSIGEYVAACISGVFSLEDALAIVALRGKLMQQQPTGAMVSVSLPEKELLPLLNENLSLAAVNTPTRCVVSGPHQAVEKFEKQLKEEGRNHEVRRLHTSHAFHSFMMDPVLAPFEERIKRMGLNKPRIPYISNVTGKWITVADAQRPGYWAQHLSKAVRFGDGLEELMKEENSVFLEVGPGNALSTFARQHPGKKPGQFIVNLVRHPRENEADNRFLLEKIGELWLYGITVDWSGFHAGEKRYRLPMPLYPFERQPFWIKDTPLDFDVAAGVLPKKSLGKQPDIGDWFYTPVWKQSVLNAAVYENSGKGFPGKHCWVVFADDCGVGTGLVEHLKEQDQDICIVKRGSEFREIDNRANIYTYTVNPRQDDDYMRLFETLAGLGKVPGRILHLWNMTANGDESLGLAGIDDLLDFGFYSLTNIARVLGRQSNDDDVKIKVIVCTTYLHSVTGEEMPNPGKAAVLGPVKVIPLEYPNIICKSIDFVLSEAEGSRAEIVSGQILKEMVMGEGPRDIDTASVIAYRGTSRWVQTFESVPFPEPEDGNPGLRLRKGGVYLVTGGLGGIGLVLARHLAQQWQARLVLTGRTPIPPRGEWEKWLQEKGKSNQVSLKIKKLREIEESGGEVLTLCADTANPEQMQAVISQTKERFGPVNGVIHCAGVPDGAVIQRRTREWTEHILAPKVRGTVVLDTLLNDASPDFFVLCSSVNSILAPMGQVGYAAANAFLDSFSFYKTARDGIFTVSIDWDTWQEVGMAVKALNPNPVELDHYLFDQRIDESADQRVYVSRFSLERHWFLREHRYMGKGILPGTVFLEIARAAFELQNRSGDGAETVEINDVYFLSPLVVDVGEEKEVYTLLKRLNDGEEGFEFTVKSRLAPGEDQWQEHTRGKIAHVKSTPLKSYQPDKIGKTCSEEEIFITGEEDLPEHGLQYGPRWMNKKWMKFGSESGLALLELPREFSRDMEYFKLHPALLDMAGSFLSFRLEAGGVYLPFSYKRLRIANALPARVYSFARKSRTNDPDKRTSAFDISIMDEEGNPLVEIEAFTRRTVTEDRINVDINANMDVETLPENLLRDGILPQEGINVFNRILCGSLPQVVVSTRNFTVLSEEYRKWRPSIADTRGKASTAVVNQRPHLGVDYIAPRNQTEKRLAQLWQRFFGIDKVGIRDDFFELGGDSVKIIAVASMIHKELDVEVPVPEFFNRPKIEKLAQFIDGADSTRKGTFTAIKPVEKKDFYPLSAAQKRLFVLSQLDEESTKFNLPNIVRVEGKLDKEKVARSFAKLIERQESLRTSFDYLHGQPVQIVHHPGKVDFQVKYLTIEDNSQHIRAAVETFIHPFDLTAAPLLRVEVLEIAEDRYIFMLDVHHIAADAMACEILVQEFAGLYSGDLLPPLTVQYKDFARWQNERLTTGKIDKQGEYWKNRFKDTIPVLELPTDFPRPVIQSFAGDVVPAEMDRQMTLQAKDFAAQHGVTLYMFLLSAYYIVLHKYSGQEDIVISSATLGRGHFDLENLVGMFVNALAMRNWPCKATPYPDFLNSVKQSSLKAFENQDYQFDELVEHLDIRRDLSRNPLADVGFSFMSFEKPSTPAAESPSAEVLRIEPYNEVNKKSSKADITLFCTESETVGFIFEYCSHLFRKDTMERFAGNFLKIIRYVLKNPHAGIGEIEIITEEEKRKILYDFNRSITVRLPVKTVHGLFEEQVEKSPDSTAAVGTKDGGEAADKIVVTYRQLNEKSDGLAKVLSEKGVRPDTIVGVVMEHSIQMIIGLLGILKAGGAYLPIDPGYPEERINYMLKDSNAIILLKKSEANILDFEFPASNVHDLSPSDLAYVIYTSGTTGRPKGVAVAHGNAVNTLACRKDEYQMAPGDTALQLFSYAFDGFVTSFFTPVISGAAAVLATTGEIKDAARLKEIIIHHRVTHFISVPSLYGAILDQLTDEDVAAIRLKCVTVAGERLSPGLVEAARQKNGNIEIVNEYGVTEAAVMSTIFRHQEGDDRISVGRPIANTRIYVLDHRLQLQPIGVPGELCVSGTGVARGYLNNPELTGEKFVLPHHWRTRSLSRETTYRTGDLARWFSDGNIEFLGRIDHQVKVRGFRIETGEIENKLLQHSDVKETVVIPKVDEDGYHYLCAYLVSKKSFDVSQLREYLAGQLPDYMIPSYFIPLEMMPLTPGGKIDRKALPDPDQKRPELEVMYTAPQDRREKAIAKIWKEVLKIDMVGINDNFFDLGGTSLDMIKVNKRFKEVFVIDMPVVTMYKYPTIRSLTLHMTRQEGDKEFSQVQSDRSQALERAKKKRSRLKEKRVVRDL